MITYTKLRDGKWGIRGKGLRVGAVVDVRKLDGTVRQERVGKVLWTGSDGVSIAQVDAAAGHQFGRMNGPSRCRGCGGPVRDASHHCAMDGYCGSCAFDEFDC
jgi:hypothetical protein